jgi:hypothetical protein
MTPLNSKQSQKFTYNRFWFSFNAFVPIIDLYMGNWVPIKEKKFIVHYWHVHTLMGWIFVPLILAALTGLLK